MVQRVYISSVGQSSERFVLLFAKKINIISLPSNFIADPALF
jgi:hypothetical protein